mgnify:CR=1 FL=1
MLHIVLHEPEMPANTGNIGRTCVACGAVLHLIEPLGFRLNEKMIKRAGLDYWDKLDVRTYINFEDFLEKNNDPKIYMATTKAKRHQHMKMTKMYISCLEKKALEFQKKSY